MCKSACGLPEGDERLWEALPHRRPQLSGDCSSPQSSYFGPVPNTSSWFMAGEPEACRLTIKGENRTHSGSLLLSLPSRARLLWDPGREREASTERRTRPPLCAERDSPPMASSEGRCQSSSPKVNVSAGPRRLTANTGRACPAQALCSPHTVQINWGRRRHYPHGATGGTEAQGSWRTGRAGS